MCGLNHDRGPCRNYTQKWFFDMQYGGCSRFWYGGCEGNDNRFDTQAECTAVCMETEGAGNDFLSCLLHRHIFVVWLPRDPAHIHSFIDTTCLSLNDSNTIVSMTKPESCYLPKVSGPCHQYELHWYYDRENEQCREFYYGGCLGNNNRYKTREECQRQCHKQERLGKVKY